MYMMSRVRFRFVLLSCLACLAATASAAHAEVPGMAPRQKQAIANTVSAYAFPLSDVRLLDGPFKHAEQMDKQYLLQLSPDRLLAGFMEVAGLPHTAKKYGGWASSGVAGFTLGHYLSACSEMYAATGDQKLKQRVTYIVDVLQKCQDTNGHGYVAGIPDGKKIFGEIARGDINTQNGLNGGWVPWYTIHKDMAGLRDAYLYCDNPKAKQVLAKMADWVGTVVASLNHKQMQHMFTVEYGGMQEVLADVYAITGDNKYLKLAERFSDDSVFDPLANQHDDLAGLHANTQLAKMIGPARLYELTGNQRMKTIAQYFWTEVATKRSYVTGDNSDSEHFGKLGDLHDRLSRSTTETCNEYNILKLTQHLMTWDPKAEYADFYERGLYNDILASQDPKTGMMTYYMSLDPGTFKTFSSPFDSFWCCVGTGIENHAKYGTFIYYHGQNSLYLNLFIPSVLQWQAKGITVHQDTQFPVKPSTKLTLNMKEPQKLTLYIRHPYWAKSGFAIKVNGQTVPTSSTPSSYAKITRTWHDGDTVQVQLLEQLHLDRMANDPQKGAIMYGPLLLGGKLGTKGMHEPMPYAKNNQDAYFNVPAVSVPDLVIGNTPVAQWVKPVQGKPLTFKTVNVGKPNDVTLAPFYEINHQRTSVYWNMLTQNQWQKREAIEKADTDRQAQIARDSIDVVHVGEQQSEHDHHLKASQSNTGPYGNLHWRDATANGWISYQLAVDPNKPIDVVGTYWGGEIGNRKFNILVDGTVIGTQTLSMNRPGKLFDVTYPVPQSITHGKHAVTVTFKPDGGMVGGLFGVRTVVGK